MCDFCNLARVIILTGLTVSLNAVPANSDF
jgi:hypothetical protein